MKEDTYKMLLEQSKVYNEKWQTWLQSILYISQMEMSAVHSIVIE